MQPTFKKILFVFCSLLLLCSAGGAQASVIGKPANNLGLVGYWSFNEGTGSIAGDFSGNKNSGTLTNSPVWTNGKLGGGLNFNGSNTYAQANESPSLDISGSAITLSAWVNVQDNGQAQQIIVKPFNATTHTSPYFAYSLHLLNVDSTHVQPRFWIGTATTNTNDCANSSMTTGAWHHIVGTYDGANLKLYIDGVQSCQVGATGAILSYATPLRLGINGGFSETLNGAMDEVRIYNRALSATEVAALYNSGASHVGASSASLTNGSTLASGLVGLWTFDGADVTDKVYDKSGQGNNGYFVGSATSTAKVIGKLGQALKFNGSTNYINVGSNASLTNPFASGGTISAWIYPTGYGGGTLGRVVDKTDSTSLNNGFNLQVDNNGTDCTSCMKFVSVFSGGQGFWRTPSNSISLNKWYHVVAVYNNSSAANAPTIYINGVSQSITLLSTPSGTYSSDSGLPLIIGNVAASTDRSFDGKIDDVRIYNRALSAAEAQQLYNLGGQKLNTSSQALTNGSTLASGLVGLWTFDGLDVTDKVYDKSGQGNNGYFYGSATSSAKTIGKLGQALRFNGSNSNTVGIAYTQTSVTQYTESAWVKIPSGTNGGPIIQDRGSGAGSSLTLGIGTNGAAGACAATSGGLYFADDSNALIIGNYYNGGLNDGNWHLVTGVFNASSGTSLLPAHFSLYVDGALVTPTGTCATGSATSPLSGLGNTQIGYHQAWTSYFTGTIDDVRIYNRALSSSEVAQLYSVGR